MAERYLTRGQTMRITSTCCCLALMPASAGAQSGMSRAEAAQLYAAAGFSILQNQPVNRCGKPAKPRVTFVDINGDKQPEALFVDENVDCYAPSGRYFAVLTKEGTSWRSVISGTGSIQAMSNRTAGWLDMRVTDSGCVRNHRYDGRTYKAATGCLGEAVGAAPQPAQPRQPVQSLNPAQPVAPPSTSKPAVTTLQAADEAAAFKAAGFTKRGAAWRSGCDDPGQRRQHRQGGRLERRRLARGRPHRGWNVLLRQYRTGILAGQQARERELETHDQCHGHSEFLKTKGIDGWPDVSIGGPGFCFPVARWNGREYKFQRWEYDGKACKPPR